MAEFLGMAGLVTLAALLFALSFVFKFAGSWRKWKQERQYNLPPAPAAWPVLGHLHLILDSRKLPHHTMREVAKAYGPVVLLKLGSVNTVFVTDPGVALECFREQDLLLAHRPINMAYGGYVTYKQHHVAFADHGDHWRYLRKVFRMEMLSSSRIQHFGRGRSEEVSLACRALLEAAQRNEAVTLRSVILDMTLNVVTQMSMGQRFFGSALVTAASAKTAEERETASEAAEWHSIIEEMSLLLNGFLVEDFLPALSWIDRLSGVRGRMQTLFNLTDRALDKIMDKHRRKLAQQSEQGVIEEEKARNFVEVLLTLRNQEGTGPLNDYTIKALIMEMLEAGSETPAVAIEWAMAELLANPEVMKKAQAEMDAVVGKERYLEETDIPKLPYLQAVIKEAFRKHQVSPWIPRSNRVDCKIAGYDIPANSSVFIQHWAMGHDPALWKHPEVFDPERFLGSGIEVYGQHMQLLAFGSGRRICPGVNFAYDLVHFTLARFIHSFDWRLPDGIKPSELDMSEVFGFFITFKNHPRAHPTPRLSAHVYTS